MLVVRLFENFHSSHFLRSPAGGDKLSRIREKFCRGESEEMTGAKNYACGESL